MKRVVVLYTSVFGGALLVQLYEKDIRLERMSVILRL